MELLSWWVSFVRAPGEPYTLVWLPSESLCAPRRPGTREVALGVRWLQTEVTAALCVASRSVETPEGPGGGSEDQTLGPHPGPPATEAPFTYGTQSRGVAGGSLGLPFLARSPGQSQVP